MGRYADNLKEQKAAQEADQKYVDTTEIGEAIEAALGEEGTITSAISAAMLRTLALRSEKVQVLGFVIFLFSETQSACGFASPVKETRPQAEFFMFVQYLKNLT